jgi:hypothetical protein
MSNIFNQQGELSAGSVKEALSKIVKYASIIDELSPSSSSLTESPSFSESQRDEMIHQALSTQEGKIALGQAMANPIRRNLDYQGVGRKALVVDPLPQGALPVYDRDIDVAAVVISSNGSVPESRVFGDRVSVPEFEVVSNPTVRIAEVKRRRFNVIDRAQQKARQEIQAQEDANIFAALDFASDSTKGGENDVQILDGGFATGLGGVGSGPGGNNQLAKVGLLNLKRQIDRWDNVTAKYFMNINEFTDILNWESAGAAGASSVDPVTQRELLQTGLYGHIFGADIIVSKIVPPKQVFACAEPEFVGVMPVRQDIEVLPADEPKQLKLGWVVSEIIGVAIVNPRGVASGLVSA